MAYANLGTVDAKRLQRWKQAAEKTDRPFAAWARVVLDRAAEETEAAKEQPCATS